MQLSVIAADLFTQRADALIVPIDGAVHASESIDRILGNIGRQLVRRVADADVLEQIESQLDLPLPLGRATAIECEGTPFRTLVLLSTLHHTDAHDEGSKRALVRRSFSAAIECAARASARSVLTGVLQGGWRMSATEAFAAMLSALDERAPIDSITVCCLEEEQRRTLRAHAASVGW
jgi:hypothetical protein